MEIKEKEERKTKRISTAIVLFCIIFSIAAIGQTMLIVRNYGLRQTFIEGVRISQINVSGLTRLEAEKELSESLNQKIKEMNLTITYNEKQWKFTGADFKVQNEVKTIINDAYNYQQKLIRKKNNFTADTIVAKGLNVDIAFQFLFQDINDKVNMILKEVEKPAVNSRVSFYPDKEQKFEYSKSFSGIKVDKQKLLKDIESEFMKNHSNMQVSVNAMKVAPQVTEDYLKDKTKLISIFSTDLHNSKERRLHNVALALSKVNGITVKPNEEISFNALTSPQTLEGGYEKSIIIFNGQFVEGVGGGLCQASTTLYNALILSNLEILEVNKHTLPVGYIELALDAMVSENWSDLRFKNNSENNIYIVAYLKEERAYVEIYGKTLDNRIKVKRRSEFIKTIGHPGDKIIYDEKGEYTDKVLYKGERFRLAYPREGYEAKAYLQYYSAGNLIKEVEIRHEVYEPQFGLVVEGVNAPPEGYEVKTDVEIMKPQETTSDTTGNNVSAVILKTNPPDYNP